MRQHFKRKVCSNRRHIISNISLSLSKFIRSAKKMYNGIGLTTPRGSGTNGHIQSNKFFVRPKSTTGKDAGGHGPGAGLPKKPNKDILEHDRKRQIELKLVVLEDKLSDQGYTDSEISERITEARKNLEAAAALEAAREAGEFTPMSVSDIKVSDTQTHHVAARKEKQMETLRAAFGIVPDVPLKNDEPKLNSEDVIEDDKISDGSNNEPNDDVQLRKKDPKTKNSDTVKAAQVKKNESGRDGNELNIHQNQHAKELGELTDSSNSESDSDQRSKNPSRGNKKGRRHDDDYSDSADEIYVKENRKLHDNRSRRHGNADVDSDDEDYERHEKMSRKHADNVKSENERYDDRYDKNCRYAGNDEFEKTSKRSDRKGKERDYVVSKDNEVQYEKVSEVKKVSSSDRWNNKDDKDNRRYGAGNNIDPKKTRKLTKNNENRSRNKRHDSDDDDDTMKIEKSGKHYRSINETRSDSYAEDDRRRKEEREKSRSGRGGDIRNEERKASTGIEGKANKIVDVKEDTSWKVEDSYRSKRDTTEDGSREMTRGKRKLEDESPDEQPVAKSRSRSTKKELNENQQKGLEENKSSSRNKDDTDQLMENSRERKSVGANRDKQAHKISGDEKPHKEIDMKLNLDHKKEERVRREIRDIERREERDHRERRSDLDRREERDHRERRSDLDLKEERDHREKRIDLDRKEERESRKYSMDDDEDRGRTRHRKDEKRENVEGEHGRSRRREREEDKTSERDEKTVHVDSSKRVKYDEFRSEEKRRYYDDDKRDNRDDVRAKRRV